MSASGLDYSNWYYYIWSASTALIGYVMYKLNRHDEALNGKVSHEELKEIISDKLQPTVERVANLKEDLSHLRESIGDLSDAINNLNIKIISGK